MSKKATVKTTKFETEVLNRLQENTDIKVAKRNYQKGSSAIVGQIAALKAKKVDDEIAIQEAEEDLADATYPITIIKNNQQYVEGIQNAKFQLRQKNLELEATEESIEQFEALLKEFE